MKKKSLKLMSVLLILSLVLVGCGQKAEEANANPMKYISVEDLKGDIDSGANEYIILDVRQAKDYEESHIKGAILADQHAANKEGDDATGIANLKVALKEATGSEEGSPDVKYALVCYSGKSYAQKATDLLIEMGVSGDQIFTVEGGMKAWTEAGDDYNSLLE